MVLTNIDIITRLVTILALAGLIGLEREYHGKPAGLRTNIMVGLGSTLMTMTSIRVVELFPERLNADPMRLAAQIVVGIGFIGAGAILREVTAGHNVIGLTTAATLWVVAGLGIAVGCGLYFEAIAATALVFFTFLLLGRIVSLIRKYAKAHPSSRDSSQTADKE